MTSRDAAAAALPVAPGDLVAGKYRVERVHAAGGMGAIVVARHLELEQDVAIKIMLRAADDELVVARFLREARAAARIQSNHVARVFDCGRLDGGTPYMVMEYLEGEDLRQILATRGAPPLTEAVDLLIEATQGVADAHVLGIV